MSGCPPSPPPPAHTHDEYYARPPTPPDYPKGYNTYGGYPPPPPDAGSYEPNQSPSNQMTAHTSSNSMQPNFITPNFSGALQNMLPGAGAVRPSDGGVVQSSKFVSSSETKKDGVQHKQSLNYKMTGESGKYKDSKEWFERTKGQGSQRGKDGEGSDSEEE